MELGRVNSLLTKVPLTMLRRRAYSRARFEQLARASAFRVFDITAVGIGIEVRLTKRPER